MGEVNMSKRNVYKLSIILFGLLPLSSVAFSGLDYGRGPSHTRTNEAIQADAFFWHVFHGGQYDQIPAVLNALTGAYLADPYDAITTAHVGFTHVWRLSERWRLDDPIPATITDHQVLARKYFQVAVRLNPYDARYLGFLGDSTLGEGDIHRDEKLVRKGYSILLKAIRAFPEFNYITGGLVESVLPSTSKRFKRALEWQWKTIDLCVGEKIDRENPDVSPYMYLATTEGDKRVCWNGWITPHNFEGFYLNMGDMLVKSGNWRTAQKIYVNAKLSPDYPGWKYGDFLDQRILEAEANVALFNQAPGPSGRPGKPVMFETAFSCMSCHQN